MLPILSFPMQDSNSAERSCSASCGLPPISGLLDPSAVVHPDRPII